MKRYTLEPMGGNRRGAIRLAAAEFDRIASARRGLLVATGLEEKLHFLLDNYADFERTLLDLALKHLVFAATGWFEFQDDILTINRRLANLLSAARSYLDQLDHDLSGLFGSASEIRETVRVAKAGEYDSRLGYRALEALRNYQQHRGFSVQHVSIGASRREVGTQIFVAHGVTPSISTVALRRDGGIKKAILAELETRGQLVPLVPLVRDYVEGLAVVHAAARAAVASKVAEWDRTVGEAMARGRRRFGKSGFGFIAIAHSDDGTTADEAQLFDDFMSRRRLLECRSRHVTKLAKHYVSGRAAAADA